MPIGLGLGMYSLLVKMYISKKKSKSNNKLEKKPSLKKEIEISVKKFDEIRAKREGVNINAKKVSKSHNFPNGLKCNVSN